MIYGKAVDDDLALFGVGPRCGEGNEDTTAHALLVMTPLSQSYESRIALPQSSGLNHDDVGADLFKESDVAAGEISEVSHERLKGLANLWWVVQVAEFEERRTETKSGVHPSERSDLDQLVGQAMHSGTRESRTTG